MPPTILNTKLQSSLVSVAAAHNFTTRVGATWYPPLVRTPRVLVPIELSVLMVRDASQTWANCGMTPPVSADPPTPAASLTPDPFSELQTPRPRGAYLQWYLPNGLTGGTADAATNELIYPPIPDRWLVLRISNGATPARRAIRGWVIQGGDKLPQPVDLKGWTEPGTASQSINPLTALGHGALAWAGYFDNVVNRLGFYDNTLDSDQVSGPVAYVVCGWYANPTQDPLGDQNITSLAGFNAKLEELEWSLDAGQLDEVTRAAVSFITTARDLGFETVLSKDILATNPAPSSSSADYTTNGSWWPQATLFHGAVVGIDWPGSRDTTEVGGPPPASSITVATGNTLAETMGKLIAQANNAPDQASFVEALQLGVLKELDQPDGRAQLDVRLHASSFASQSGGPATHEPVNIAPSGPPQAPPSNPPAPGPGIFKSPLNFKPPVEIFHPIETAQSTGQVGHLTVPEGTSNLVRSEEKIITGRLNDVISKLGVGVTIPPTDPGGTADTLRAAPRLFTPKDPVILVQGGKRAFVHDSSVQTEDGKLVCRLSPVTEISWTTPGIDERLSVGGGDVLESGVENGSIPPECEGILRESVLLDTGSAPAIAATAAASVGTATFNLAAAQRNITVEQTAWYSLRNPRIDHGPLLALSGLAGRLPAPFSIAPASRPWTPLHLDWSVEFVPSPNGVNDWTLDEIDFVLATSATVPTAGSGTTFTGRSTLTGGASSTLASAIRDTLRQTSSIGGTAPVPAGKNEAFFSPLAQHLSIQIQKLSIGGVAPAAIAGSETSQLNDIASALDQMDIISCGLGGILTQLRGGIPPDGVTKPTDGKVPSPFFAIRAGFLRIIRLRLVDGFGQFVDLCGSDATHPAQGIVISDPMSVPAQPGVLAFPPRFSAPTRAWFRFMSADTPGIEADYQTSPVCAFLMPNHLDGSLEFFDSSGKGAGSLQPRGDGRVIWQGAPGTSTAAGQNPVQALTNTYAAQLAQSLVDWGITDAGQTREPALGALLRTIDSTLWSVDPFGHAGEEHLSLLLGHPICVMRALLRLDVIDPVTTPDGTVTVVPIRLGNLTQWQDGLFGYFVNDDYSVLHIAEAASSGMARQIGPQLGFLQQINLVPQYYAEFTTDLASLPAGATTGSTPVTHPYIDASGVLWVRPNQTINLTLLVEPLTTIHATAGLVPRKEIGMRRTWVDGGLAAIAPTFRFGPVLVDPQHIRMPLATDLKGTWVWDYRSDATTWQESPATNATDDALLGQDPPTASEGWLNLNPKAVDPSTSS